MKKSEIFQELPKCDRDWKWANRVEEMALINLLNASCWFVKTKISARCNNVKYIKIKYVCNSSIKATKHPFMIKKIRQGKNLIRDLGVGLTP